MKYLWALSQMPFKYNSQEGYVKIMSLPKTRIAAGAPSICR